MHELAETAVPCNVEHLKNIAQGGQKFILSSMCNIPISYLFSVIIRLRVVFRKTVVGD